MSFFRYITSFLYERNWHTGQRELSKPRVVALLMLLFVLILATLIILFLQAPVTAERI